MSAVATGVIVALVVAIVQFFFLFPSLRAQKLIDIKVKAYSEFIESVSVVKFQNRSTSSLQSLTASLVAITVFAEKDVIDKLYEFKASGMDFENVKSREAFIDLVQSFRKSLLWKPEPQVADRIISTILFGK